MKAKASLSQALAAAAGRPVGDPAGSPEATTEVKRKTERPPSRKGKKAVAAFVSREVWKQLRSIAVDRDTTLQACLVEALNDFFEKYHRPRIAA